jgi:hypothetical protein
VHLSRLIEQKSRLAQTHGVPFGLPMTEKLVETLIEQGGPRPAFALELHRVGGGLIFDNRYNHSGARLTIIPAAARRLTGRCTLCGATTRLAREIR